MGPRQTRLEVAHKDMFASSKQEIISKTIPRNTRPTSTKVWVSTGFTMSRQSSVCIPVTRTGLAISEAKGPSGAGRLQRTFDWVANHGQQGGAQRARFCPFPQVCVASMWGAPTGHGKQMEYLSVPAGNRQVTFASGRPRLKSRGLFRCWKWSNSISV